MDPAAEDRYLEGSETPLLVGEAPGEMHGQSSGYESDSDRPGPNLPKGAVHHHPRIAEVPEDRARCDVQH